MKVVVTRCYVDENSQNIAAVWSLCVAGNTCALSTKHMGESFQDYS